MAGKGSPTDGAVYEVVLVPDHLRVVDGQIDDPDCVLGYRHVLVDHREKQLVLETFSVEVGLESDKGVDLGREGGEYCC